MAGFVTFVAVLVQWGAGMRGDWVWTHAAWIGCAVGAFTGMAAWQVWG